MPVVPSFLDNFTRTKNRFSLRLTTNELNLYDFFQFKAIRIVSIWNSFNFLYTIKSTFNEACVFHTHTTPK